jgi:uridine kinase
MTAESIIEDLAKRISKMCVQHPLQVAIDGRTASGKTTFADALAAKLLLTGRPVMRASIDGFHRPREERYRKGRMSACGYYEDAHELAAVRRLLLDPLGPSGDWVCVTASFDLVRDEPLQQVPTRASRNTVLIADGEFLQRPELQGVWEYVIFLKVSADEALRRGVERDAASLGGAQATLKLHSERYGAAFGRYEKECRPAEHADVVIDNEE